MQYIIYIGKNKKYIKDFSQLAKRNIYYSVNDYSKAIPLVDKIENNEDIILFYEREECKKDVADIKELRKKYPFIYIVLVTETSLDNEASEYLKAGINNTISPSTSQEEINELFSFHEKRRKEHMQKRERSHTIKIFKLPLWKRLFDITFSLASLVVLSPVFIATAIAIWLENKGPVIQKNKRVGTNYLIFDFLRFRSTYVAKNSKYNDWDDLIIDDMENETILVPDDFMLPEEEYNLQPKKKNTNSSDPEDNTPVTKVGRFIRKYSIDELPQLINILKGEMSVVGNRPLPLHEAELLTSDDYIDRFMAPAGLTGLWQVEKKGDSQKISEKERKLLDVKYAKTFCFAQDMKIILRTTTAIVQKTS
jgi:Sugar transferases involved in lipopolysaccharide synthesis